MKKILSFAILAMLLLPMAVMGQLSCVSVNYDGHTYPSVLIGSHCWMAENLRATHYADGSNINPVYQYGDPNVYGRLYSWYSAMNVAEGATVGEGLIQGVCPTGWHLPTAAEVEELKAIAVSNLHSSDLWRVPGNNNTGFNMVPNGKHNSSNSSNEKLNMNSFMWTAAETNAAAAKAIWTDCYCDLMVITENTPYDGMAVRCVENPIFKCNEEKVKDADDIEYTTVQIGNQCWMAENLRTNTANGVFPQGATTETLKKQAGRLYNWTDMMNGEESSSSVPSNVQGICPDGWHIPSDAEWDTLSYNVYKSTEPYFKCTSCSSSRWERNTKCIGQSLALKSNVWTSKSDCKIGNYNNTTESTGFNAFPAGYSHGGNFGDYGLDAYFWSATQNNDKAYRFCLNNDNDGVIRNSDYKGVKLSVRCICNRAMKGNPAPELPMSVTTDSANTVTAEAAKVYGTVVDLGGHENVMAGFKYGQNRDQLTSFATEAEKSEANAIFSADLSSLSANTKYYYVAYVRFGEDTIFADNILDFTTLVAEIPCEGTVKDGNDNTYPIVKIGDQCWMAQNMRATKTNTGENISSTPTDVESVLRAYPLSGKDVSVYGLMYNHLAAMSVCPTGWHLPTQSEWNTLITYVGNNYACGSNSNNVATALAAKQDWNNCNWNDCTPGKSLTDNNASQFSAFPAGTSNGYSAWQAGAEANFRINDNDSVMQITYDKTGVSTIQNVKKNGYSVRCIRDNQ